MVGPASPAPSIDRKLALARDLANALDRTLRMRRTYTPEHQQAVQATHELIARIVEFFKHYAYLRITVTSKEFKFDKHVIYTASQPETSIPFKLYKDGIREFRINRGISKEELIEFLAILDMDPQEIVDTNEDIIALLWRCGFRYIDYIVVDEFDPATKNEGMGVEGAGSDPGREQLIKEINETIAGYVRLRDLAPVTFDVPGGLGQNLPARASVDPDKIPQVIDLLNRPMEETSKRIRDLVEAEHLGSNMARTIDTLLDLLETGSELDVKHIIPFLQAAIGYYLARKDFSAIGHLLIRVNFQALLPKIPELSEVVKRLEAEVKSPSLPQNLVTYLNRGFKGDQEGLKSLFNVLGPAAMKVLTQIYPQVLSARTRALIQSFLLKYAKADTDPLRSLLQVPDGMLFEVFEILGQIKPAWAAKEMEGLIKHPSQPIRLRAISLLGKLEGLARTQMLMRLLKDPDAQVRIHALRTLEEARDQGTLLFIKEWFEDKDFLSREPVEKVATLSAYAIIGGDNVLGVLRGIAEKKLPMLGKDKAREFREAAVMAIARVGTPAALEIIRQFREKGDDQLKTFVESIVKPVPKKYA